VLRRPVEFAQYLSIGYTERLASAEAVSSVGSRGDSYDNALAETVNGLYKAELIRRHHGPWRSADEVELATAEWVEFWNNRRLHEACGYLPPAEFEAPTMRVRRRSRPPDSNRQGLHETQGGSLGRRSRWLRSRRPPGRAASPVTCHNRDTRWLLRAAFAAARRPYRSSDPCSNATSCLAERERRWQDSPRASPSTRARQLCGYSGT
jgi:hypothetical protein